MKKLLMILLCLSLFVPLFGCDSGETAPSVSAPSESVPTETVCTTEIPQTQLATEIPPTQLDTEFPVPSLDELKSMLCVDTLISAEDVTPPKMLEQSGMRLLHCTRETEAEKGDSVVIRNTTDLPEFDVLLGPYGCVTIEKIFSSGAENPLLADLDGDGVAEFVYDTIGPTSGILTWAYWAYGLEDGMPVLKANAILWFQWEGNVDYSLKQDGDHVVFEYGGERYPLAIEENRIVFPEGLPKDVSDCGGLLWGIVGASLKRIREQFAEWIVYDTNCCVIWRIPGAAADDPPEVYAALSKNWQTVSGLIGFRVGADGKLGGWRKNDTPLIETPTDPESLIGLTVNELEERLGPAHFDSGSGIYLSGWFTEDGLLLQVTAGVTVTTAGLYDPMKDEWIASAGESIAAVVSETPPATAAP